MNAFFTLPDAPATQSATAPTRRILSLHFPHLPADRIARRRWGLGWRLDGRPQHPPVVFFAKIENADMLTALDEAAEALGLSKGSGLAEARAMHPQIDAIPADQAADRRFLEALADWCDRYTPLVALDGEDGLMLDISGCAHLFGGEQALGDDIVRRLRQLGIDARCAIADTPGLAWAAARHGGGIVPREAAETLLAAMPVAALRLDPAVVAGLRKLGLRTVGTLIAAPRAPLARRFGRQLLLRLDQALGREDEPISPRRPVAAISAERRLSEPIVSEEAVLALSRCLADSLKASLEARDQGGRLFELILFRIDGRVFRVAVATSSPTRRPERIGALFKERLERLKDAIDAGFGFEILRLNVLIAEPLAQGQADLAEGGAGDPAEAFLLFVDQVVARFGEAILALPVDVASHWPERAARLAPVAAAPGREAPPTPPARAERPLRLFARPELVEVVADLPDGPPASFKWRRLQHRVVRAEGPERLGGEWWREGESVADRDYFRIEDQEGHRYWLYREGLYERGGAIPRWFVQGVFA